MLGQSKRKIGTCLKQHIFVTRLQQMSFVAKHLNDFDKTKILHTEKDIIVNV